MKSPSKDYNDAKFEDDDGSGEYAGDHPLEGINNFKDLPPPEPLTGKSK
jgi:hypothetical protein